MNDMIDGEYRFELVLNDPALSNAKGMQWQARCEQTVTGVKWILAGDLAAAVHRMMHTAPTPNDQEGK